MRRIHFEISTFLIVVIGIISTAFTLEPMVNTLRVMSYNIRYDNPDDGPHAWEHRKGKVTNLIRFYQADLIGLQEVLYEQLTYLDGQLDRYDRIGVGRDDGKQQGEYSPIFYATDKLAVVDSGTFWLSETPGRPSVGWDASLERIATWGQFRVRATGDTIFFFNTHFDHRGEQARRQSARLLLRRITEQAKDQPVVVTGDFNSSPESVPYRLLTADQNLRDALVVSNTPSVGPHQSFSGFEVVDSLPGERIDYVLVSDEIEVHRHAIIASFDDGAFPSDHLPVVADVGWE